MKRRVIQHSLYWIFVLMFLTLFFGTKWQSATMAFYFSCLLVPVVIGTTYVFNEYLVPKYLLTGRYKSFCLYFFYLLVLSLYLELLVALFSLVFIAKLNLELVNLGGLSVIFLGMTLYLIVFVSSFVKIAIEYKKNKQILETLKSENERNEQVFLSIRSNRKNQRIPFEAILYIESLNDTVKIVTSENVFTTRKKISKLNASLPTHFVRIHRSFIVNRNYISSFSSNEVNLNDIILPISRTYKKTALPSFKKASV